MVCVTIEMIHMAIEVMRLAHRARIDPRYHREILLSESTNLPVSQINRKMVINLATEDL